MAALFKFLLKWNGKSYALYRMVMVALSMDVILSNPLLRETTTFSAFCTAIHIFATRAPREFKFHKHL